MSPRRAPAIGVLANDRALVPLHGPAGAEWLPGTDVLRLGAGQLCYLPPTGAEPVTVAVGDVGAAAAVEGHRAWLGRGIVPGPPAEWLAAARSLRFLRALLRPDGALLRDPGPAAAPGVAAPGVAAPGVVVDPVGACLAAAALEHCGHHAEATAVVRFLTRIQQRDGTWPAWSEPGAPASYHRAGSSPAASPGGAAGRPRGGGGPRPARAGGSLEPVGWFCWGVWACSVVAGDEPAGAAVWPAVRRAAGAGVRALGRDGLPTIAAPGDPERRPRLAECAALGFGLRAAGDLAEALGHRVDRRRFRHAAAVLDGAIWRRFHRAGSFHRATRGSDPDAAVTWLAPPFRRPDPEVASAVSRTAAALAAPGGGHVPHARGPGDPDTAVTAAFALAAAALGGPAAGQLEPVAQRAWLLDHRTPLGGFPARVRRGTGAPVGPAPAARTHALYLLALVAGRRGLPIP